MERKLLPRITIVMPSFNQANYIAESIQSILDQNYPNLEFMILDGGSTDGSAAIIERYAERLTYWHSRPDKGQTYALIQGFARATGVLMGWVNSDDVLLPGALQCIAEAYFRYPEGGLFGGNYVLIDCAGRIIRCKRNPSDATRFARVGRMALNQPGSFFSPRAYKAVGGLHTNLQYVMDTDLYVRLLLSGAYYVYVDSYLAAFRKHATAKTVAMLDHAKAESVYVRHTYWPADVAIKREHPLWAYSYMFWQVVNGNYLRMACDTLLAKGQHWQVWAEQQLRSKRKREHAEAIQTTRGRGNL